MLKATPVFSMEPWTKVLAPGHVVKLS